VLDVLPLRVSVPEQNIAFVRTFLESEGFPIRGEDLGGDQPREVFLHTGSGQVFVRKVVNGKALKRLIDRERQKRAQAPRYGDVTLFQQE
jgi:chemotaxis protein CheD